MEGTTLKSGSNRDPRALDLAVVIDSNKRWHHATTERHVDVVPDVCTRCPHSVGPAEWDTWRQNVSTDWVFPVTTREFQNWGGHLACLFEKWQGNTKLGAQHKYWHTHCQRLLGASKTQALVAYKLWVPSGVRYRAYRIPSRNIHHTAHFLPRGHAEHSAYWRPE